MSEIDIEEFEILDPTGDTVDVPRVLPVLPVRDVVVFPGVTVPLTIGRQRSLAALEEAEPEGFMLVVTQKDPSEEEPSPSALQDTGTIVKVLRAVDAQRTGRQAIVVGIARVRLGEVMAEDPAGQVLEPFSPSTYVVAYGPPPTQRQKSLQTPCPVTSYQPIGHGVPSPKVSCRSTSAVAS